MMDTIAAVATDPPTADEVARAKTRILQGMETRMANSQQAALGLSDAIAAGDWRLYFVNYDQIKRVTPADVVRVAELYFKPSNRTVGEFIPTAEPDRTEVPASPDLEALLKDYKTGLSVTPGEAFDPTPANIEKHLTRATLPNGMKLVMLPKTSRGGTVSATIQLRFGDEQSLTGLRATGDLTGALLMRGTKTKTRQQLQDEMVKLNARINVNGGAGARHGHDQHDRSEPGAGASPRRRDAARTRVPGRGVRPGEAAARGGHREQPDRPGRARAARAQPRHEPVPARRCPVRRHDRRADRGRQQGLAG